VTRERSISALASVCNLQESFPHFSAYFHATKPFDIFIKYIPGPIILMLHYGNAITNTAMPCHARPTAVSKVDPCLEFVE
jgi:hypothetical protein